MRSSLTRKLQDAGAALGEDQMQRAEMRQFEEAARWGLPVVDELGFLASLQHDGAPTRLLDVSSDANVAAWFAVEQSDKEDGNDGRIIAWGTRATNDATAQPPTPNRTGSLFWHQWNTEELREENDWGTGKTLLHWRPLILSDRMRAQRAAFLFDTPPLHTATEILDTFKTALGKEWTSEELAGATRILGIPSPIDEPAASNSANIVPLFSIRIQAAAKESIRAALEAQNLTEEMIYPDYAGYIKKLARLGGRIIN